MSEGRNAAIGGYFELELPRLSLPYPEAIRFQSARAAFLALLQSGKPKRVWMPRHICDAMLAPLYMAGIECVFYDLTDHFDVNAQITIGDDDWLLYVNYFGVCDAQVAETIERFSPENVVLDYSQAFYSPPVKGALATIYSPRKFFGVPDGGILISRLPVPMPDQEDVGSWARTSHLLRRLGDSPESGYAEYQRAESSLAACSPARMSMLTKRILMSIDYAAVSTRRMENYLFLQNRLGPVNQLSLPSLLSMAPLCYPFLSEDRDLRNRLIRERIFVATYWPDVVGRVDEAWSEKMVRRLLPLPIDQRYGREDMKRLVSVILGGAA